MNGWINSKGEVSLNPSGSGFCKELQHGQKCRLEERRNDNL